jgi:translocation and assembly module TamB
LKKRTAALAFLTLVLALVAATLLVLRTRWAGERICGLAAARLGSATGLDVAFAACRVDPLALELQADLVRLGPADSPLFSADAIAARLAPIQALGRQVHLAELRLVRPRLSLEARKGGGGGGSRSACAPALSSHIDVRRVEIVEGSLDVALSGGVHVAIARLDARAWPSSRTLRALAKRTSRVEVDARDVRLGGLDQPIALAQVRASGDLAHDLSTAQLARAEAELEGVRFSARGRVRDLCKPDLALDVSAEGGLREVLALGRIHEHADADGTVSAEARVSGPARAPAVSGTLRLSGARVAWFKPGDVRALVHLVPGALAVDRLEWPYAGGLVVANGTVGLGSGIAIDGAVEADGVDLAEILERVDVGGSWVSVKLDLKGRIAGTLHPPALAGAMSGEFRELRSFTRSWRQAAGKDPPVVAVRRGRIQSGFEVTAQELSFHGARVSAGRGTSEIDAVARFAAAEGFHVRWRGQVDLGAIGKVADIPWAGLADVDGTIGAAPYANPRIAARARVEGFRFLDVDLGNGAADLVYGPDFRLRISDAQGVRGQTRWRGEGVVDLEPTPAHVVSSRFEAKGRVRDLFDAVRDWAPRTRPFRDVIDGDIEVSGTGSGTAGFLDGTFDARLGTGTFLGRPFESGRAVGTYHHGEEARIERAELRRGTGLVRVSGAYTAVPPFPWDLDVSFSGTPLESLDLPGGGWSGSASGTATLRGSFEHPDVRFAANGDGVSLRGMPLGTVQAAGTVQERRVVITGGSEGLSFEGEATLDGRVPFRARARLALDDVARLLTGGGPAGLRARVRGEASGEGELAALDAMRADVRLDQVQIGHPEFKVESAGPVVLTLSRGRLELQPVTLTGPSTELTLAGSRAASGQLDVSAAGAVDLRLVAGLVPQLRRPHGRLALEAHVSGTSEDPVLVGAGRIDDGGFQLKGSQVLLSGLNGALAFSQNRILFEGLSAAVNGGRAGLSGEVELASFRPVRLRIEAALDEVPVTVPAGVTATLSGRVEAEGTPDATAVTGRLHVVRARYTTNVDLEKSLLEIRRPGAPPRPYDKAGEWLRFDLQLAVDGDVRVDNDLVQGALEGELALTGTLAAPGLVGTLSMADGSRARFRGNEFDLTHAVLDFTNRNKIEIALDVHGESQVRDYRIFMHAFGTLADPQLTLTSAPPLSQNDLITLLSLGFTRRDAAAGGDVSGVAAAAAAQALFSASGLDEQVKRFLPRGKVVRDFSVRITTEWSEASGQVEPRAEFESLLLRDRLKLRYQAPLSGARGQKAQAELRLGGHTALQYQWDNDNPDVPTGDHGVDLKLRWEWTDE